MRGLALIGNLLIHAVLLVDALSVVFGVISISKCGFFISVLAILAITVLLIYPVGRSIEFLYLKRHQTIAFDVSSAALKHGLYSVSTFISFNTFFDFAGRPFLCRPSLQLPQSTSIAKQNLYPNPNPCKSSTLFVLCDPAPSLRSVILRNN